MDDLVRIIKKADTKDDSDKAEIKFNEVKKFLNYYVSGNGAMNPKEQDLFVGTMRELGVTCLDKNFVGNWNGWFKKFPLISPLESKVDKIDVSSPNAINSLIIVTNEVDVGGSPADEADSDEAIRKELKRKKAKSRLVTRFVKRCKSNDNSPFDVCNSVHQSLFDEQMRHEFCIEYFFDEDDAYAHRLADTNNSYNEHGTAFRLSNANDPSCWLCWFNDNDHFPCAPRHDSHDNTGKPYPYMSAEEQKELLEKM